MNLSEIQSMLRRLFAGAAIDQKNAIRSCRAALGSLPLVVQSMVDDAGKSITIETSARIDTAETDGKTIRICPLPLPTDAADVDSFVLMTAMAYGLCHHEVGHINDSDFETLRTAIEVDKASELVMSLQGIIEDVRQENVYIALKPGTKPYLDALNAALQVKGLWPPVTDDCSPAQAFTGYLLYRMYFQYRRDFTSRELYLDADSVVRRMFPETVFTRLEGLLMQMNMLRNSEDSYELAREISFMLDDEAKKEAEQNSTVPDQSGAGGAASGAGADDGNSTPNSDKADDQASSSTSGQSQQDGQGNAPPPPSPLSQLTDPKQQDGCVGDKHELAHQALNELADKGSKTARSHIELGEAVNTQPKLMAPQDGEVRDYANVLSLTGQIRGKLVKEIQANTQIDVSIAARGRRLSSNHLHRLAAGDPRVFRRTSEEIDMDTAVLLVVDSSGSMRDEFAAGQRRIMKAMDSCFATARALEMIDGVSVACMNFPHFEVLKPFDSRRSQPERFRLKTCGSTPMHTAVYVGARMLASSGKSRRLMIVMTDGEPDDAAVTKAAVEAAERTGIEVMGLGMATDAGRNFFRRWHVLKDFINLPHSLLSLVRGSLNDRRVA